MALMAIATSRRLETALCLALVLVTAAVYAGVRGHVFVNYDDPAYVTDNAHVRDGLTWVGAQWALTATEAANWHPLTWLSHMTDVQLFGLEPGPHHLVNLLFHLANALLVFLVLRRMSGAVWPSALVAALFALHPLHVESVAWVAERKDVLSTFVGLATMWAYARYVERRSASRYAAVLALYGLGLAAKPMLVTLPFVLLLLDYWPLGRLRLRGPASFDRSLLWEKLPLFALAVGASVITFVAQKGGGAVLPLDSVPLGTRLANAVVSYAAYLGKTIWPSGLAIPYPYPASLPAWKVAGAALLLIALSGFAAAQARRRPYLLCGWLWYLVTLLPVIGIVQVGDQAMADRYTYVPLIGIFIAVAWGTAGLAHAKRRLRAPLAALAVVALIAFATSTVRQVRVWADTVSLFENALRETEGNYVAHTYLAIELKREGDIDRAVFHLEAVGEMGAEFPDAPYTLGQIHEERGDLDRAAASYRTALSMQPDHAGALVNLGRWLENRGRVDEALAHYERARVLSPGNASLENNLGVVLTRLGRADEAVAHLETAIDVEPGNVEARNNLGVALLDLNRTDEAVSQFTRVLEEEPTHPAACFNMGVASQRVGRLDEAVGHFDRALAGSPESARVHAALGDTLLRLGRPRQARAAYEEALRLDPEDDETRRKLSAILRLGAP
jgi:tetratricopeptide (TPR) repeat protein